MAATIPEIAREAGVSASTVSRALRNKGYVSAASKDKILEIARQMGYTPNSAARALVNGQSRLVGFMVTFNIPALLTVIEPVESALRKAGYPVLLHCPADTPEAQELCLEQFLQHRVTGVIAFPGVSTSNTEAYEQLIRSGTKLVIMDRRMEGLEVPQIVVDGYRVMQLATDHLISLGHKNIVHLAIPETSGAGQERAKGFKDTLSAAGIPVTPTATAITKLDENDGFKVMSKLLKRKDPPTAIIARHDIVALGAMRAIFDAGLSIPEDISVVGIGDTSHSSVYKVQLTTVHYSSHRLASLGVKKLLDMLDGKDTSADVTTLGARLVMRSSTAPPRVGA